MSNYDANGNMIAEYDTAKNYQRILYWDDDNRLTKTVDTTIGSSVTTQYHYDAKGMRIIKDGPYGESIYIDTGYVESSNSPGANPMIASNHVFVGNTRIVSVVKHKDEASPATNYYASDHLGSSSVLTTNTGSYHERIEYLPYGETWVEDKVTSDSYTTPYKFTGKELDNETGLYYFGARYYDARVSRWISADPAFQKFLPTGNKQHDNNLPAGGVFKPSNLGMYVYTSNNPLIYIDPDGQWDERIHRESQEYGGTLQWAQDVGFSKADATRIAAACASVDRGVTNPVTGDQSYHFNTNNDPNTFPSISSSGTSRDSRMERVKYHLEEAIKLWKMAELLKKFNPEKLNIQEFRDAVLIHLGAGVHAIEDVFAHSDEYVGREAGRWSHYDIPWLPGGTVPKGSITGADVDDPEKRTDALNKTEEAVKQYLNEFISATGYKKE